MSYETKPFVFPVKWSMCSGAGFVSCLKLLQSYLNRFLPKPVVKHFFFIQMADYMKTNDYLLTPVDGRLTLNEDLFRANSTIQSHETQWLIVCFWKIKSCATVKEKVQGNSQGSSNISKPLFSVPFRHFIMKSRILDFKTICIISSWP